MQHDRSTPTEQQTTDTASGRQQQPDRVAEKRVDPRRGLTAQAFVSIPSVTSRTYEVREISRGGMFLAFREARSTRQEFEQNGIEPGTHAEIAFALPMNETRYRFSLSAQITRITRQGIGVQFTTPNPPQLAAMREFFSQPDAAANSMASAQHQGDRNRGRKPEARPIIPPEGPDWELLD